MKSQPGFLRYMAAHPTAANLLMIIFLFLGLMTARELRRETFPDFSATQVEIVVTYPGASAEDVENAVCRRVEDALDGVTDLYEVQSEARENLARVVAEMKEDGDMSRFLSDVKTQVEAIDDFPDEVEKPVVKELGLQDMVVSVAVSGPMSAPDLKAYCEAVKDRMLRNGMISQIELQGFSDHQIRIEIPAGTLMQFGVSVQDIAQKIGSQSIDLPAGTIETREGDIMVRFSDERRNVPELEDLIVVSSRNGAEIRLGNIAKITDRFELDEEKIIFNGRRAGMLTVNKTKTEDALRIMDAVRDFLDRERKAAPSSVEYTLTRNVSKIVRDRLNMLLINGLQGFILVFLVMWLFFSLRFSFWVAMGLPVSFLGAIFFMQAIDFSLNMLTMVGLLLAIGLLMDDAIVISENVATHLREGKSSLDAAVSGTREVLPGVLSSYLTTLFVFGPLALMLKGDIGKVLWVMPVVLILTLSVSMIEAFLILPNHLAHSLKNVKVESTSRFRRAFTNGIEWVRENALGRAVDWAVSWRYLFLGLVIAAFLASLAMPAGGKLKFQAFPDLDGDVLQARILMPQGTPLKKTEAVVEHMVAALDRVNRKLSPLQPQKQLLVQNVVLLYNQNADAKEAGAHVATISVDLLNAETRNSTIDEISSLWREETGNLPDVMTIAFKQPAIGPAGLAIDIRLQGQDLSELKQASLDLMAWLNQYQGVLDLTDDLRPGKPEVRIKLDSGAAALGLDAATVAGQLRSAFFGAQAAEVQVGSESYEIEVRQAAGDQDTLGDLEYFHIATRSGELIPLTSVASIEPARGVARIARIDSVRTVTIQGDVDTSVANAAEIIAHTQKHFLPQLKSKYPDLDISLEGEAKETQKSMGSMKNALLVGVFSIFVILSFQFKSYIEPLVVMAAIPLALIGVIWGHVIMGYEMSMPSIMGFVSLAGVVVNNSILLVEFIKINLRQGSELAEAAKTASRIRFRAVILSSLTTMMGLLPLMLERSLQAQVLIPLSISIVFGLLASTVLVLLVIPCLYVVLGDLGVVGKQEEG